MFSPQKFSKEIGISYMQVLQMCKTGEIETVKTKGGHFKIPEKEIAKFKKNVEYISKREYEEIIRENEKLRTLLLQAKAWFNNLNII